MTYITYIYIKQNNGFVENVKFMKEIDLSVVKPGDNIEVYYSETYPFYNVAIKNEDNSYSMFNEDDLVNVTQDSILENLQKLFPTFLNQVVSSNVGDLLNDYIKADGSIERKSVFKEYLQDIKWKTGIDLNPQQEVFSLSSYIDLANTLVFLSDCLEDIKLSQFIKSSVRAFNTFLGYDGVIEDFSGGNFNTNIDDETNKEKIYFGDCLQSVHYAQNLSSSAAHLFGKKDTKKLKI